MDRFRFSTRTMLIGFACVAVVLAALARPTSATVSIANALLLLMIFVAPLGIIYRSGATRAFWVGVVVFACGPFLMEKAFGSGVRPLVNIPVQFLHRLYFGDQPVQPIAYASPPSPVPYGPYNSPTYTPPPPNPQPPVSALPYRPQMIVGPSEFQHRQFMFTEIGITTGSIIIALLGGALAVYFFRTNERRDLQRSASNP